MREGLHCCLGYNEHERFSPYQQGGTFLAANPIICSHFRDMGVDPTGLGRWSWMRFEGKRITIRIVVAYQPCVTRKQSTSSTMAQQRRYWRMKNTRACPRVLFRRDLMQHLQMWRDDGDKLVVLLDSNENMSSGPLARLFRNSTLQLQDVICARSKQEGPATFIRGQRQIDGAWATKDVSIAAAGFLPFNFGAGDHRGIYVDIPYQSFVGENLIGKPE